MDIKELMVDDWVMSKDIKVPVKVCGIMCHYGTSIYFYHEASEYIVQDFQIEPIPLTTEILEKNGFKKDIELNGCYWRPDCRKYCIVKEIDTWYFAFRHMGGGHICISECNYVHEFQHLLKVCKIEKEIVL